MNELLSLIPDLNNLVTEVLEKHARFQKATEDLVAANTGKGNISKLSLLLSRLLQ